MLPKRLLALALFAALAVLPACVLRKVCIFAVFCALIPLLLSSCNRRNQEAEHEKYLDTVTAALNKDMADSIRILSLKLSNDSSNAEAYEGLIDNYLGLDSDDKAMAIFQRGVLHVPNDTALYSRYAESLIENDDASTADDVLRIGISKVPNSFKLEHLLGECFEKEERYIDASHQYLSLLGEHPNNVELLLDVAGCCFSMKAWNQLGIYAGRALEIDSNSSVGHGYLAYYFEKEYTNDHSFDSSISSNYNAAIHDDSLNSWALLHRGLWYLEGGHVDQAWSDYRACKKIDPDNADVLYYALTKD